MPADYLDSAEALKQLDLYFDVQATRASLLYGDRAARWQDECARAFAALRAPLESAARLPDADARDEAARALGLLHDLADVPHLVAERGLRPETAAYLQAAIARLDAHAARIRGRLRALRQPEPTGIAAMLADARDELAIPAARLANHVHALVAVYDLLLVRPAYRVLNHWLFEAPLPVGPDEEAA